MNQLPIKCPICNGELAVTRLYCPQCDTTIEGHFSPGRNPFANLSPEQLQFTLTFVRCEGRFNRMEEELNLSYPTLRNRLNDVIRTLGFEPGREEPQPQVVRLSAEDRLRILDELAQGKISSEEAQQQLRGGKKGEPAGMDANSSERKG
ncbi:MAG: DUF2089 domain-containing protein [Chloroflexi bacterium]|jgi:hypothetical protein|nr:DUF2089 domain-containing protein [Chloroflexota bacterium]